MGDTELTNKARALADCPDKHHGMRTGVWPPRDKPWLRRLLALYEHAEEKGDRGLAVKCEAVLRAVVYGGEMAKHAAITRDLNLEWEDNDAGDNGA